MLRINVAALKPGVHLLEAHPEAEALGLEPEAFRDVRVEMRLDVQRDRLLVRLTARAVATLECDRTLVLFEQPVEGAYTVLFAPPGLVAELEASAEDVRPLSPADAEIDLTDVVRDTLLLAVPVRKVAPGAEELELPVRFGFEGEIDPRWEALRRLRSDDSVGEP
jgi:uncharacterized protein